MPANVAEATHLEIVSSRLFDAPRELVFRAIAEPEHLRRWWGPKGFTNTFHEFDFQTGGGWKFDMHGPNGADYANEHRFLEISRPGRIVLHHLTPPRFRMTMILDEEDRKTRLTWKMLFESEQQFHAARPICIPANEQNFDRLEAELKLLAGLARPFIISRLFPVPTQTLFDVWTRPERLKWWGPKGVMIDHIKLDLRPGGRFHYCMLTPDGAKMWGRWAISEVTPPERLVFVSSFSDEKGGLTRHPLSASWPLELLSIVTFTPRKDQTLLEIVWQPINATPDELRTFDENHSSMSQGWGGTLDRLTDYLAEPR
jgi:uncharacterized protein YndB with AHSA1/START domain